MEEFHVSPDFVAWFCGEIGIDGVEPAGAWHSLSDSDGESDLVLCVVRNGRRIGILVENKISAPEQDRQAHRYHIRGARLRDQGTLDDYTTVICAPRRYLDALSPLSEYQHRFPYEQIVSWFHAQSGRRAEWRSHIMQEAIDQSRRGYTMAVNAVITQFHADYWEYLQKNHPQLQMELPKKRGSKSNWIIFKGPRFPKGVLIHHKIDQKMMELGFTSREISDLLAVKSDWPEDIIPLQKGKTATLAIRVPPIDMTLGVAAQVPVIEEAMRAAYRLMPFSNLLQKEER